MLPPFIFVATPRIRPTADVDRLSRFRIQYDSRTPTKSCMNMSYLRNLIAVLFVLAIQLNVIAQNNCFEITAVPTPGIGQTNGCLHLQSNGSTADDTELLKYAIAASANMNRKLFLSGNFFVSSTIAIGENARIEGLNGASIRNIQPVDVLLLIRAGARNVRIENLTILESQLIGVSVLSFGGRNRNITINNVDFDGKLVTDGRNTAAIRSGLDWLDGIAIRDCTFREFQSGIFINAPIWNLTLSNNRFSQWTDFGVYIGQKAGFLRRSRDIIISNNLWIDPALGVIRQPLMIVKSSALLQVNNVTIVDNRLIGTPGAYVRGELSRAQGDMVVLQGVTTFFIRRNVIRDGGENGLTVSRLSKLGIVDDNIIFNNDQNGINIGSGSFDLIVDRPHNFSAGDAIIGEQSGASANVRFIDHDGTLVLDQAGGSPFHAEPITNLTTGQTGAAIAQFTERTKAIQVRNNLVFDNGLDANDETASSHGTLVFNSDLISFFGNRFFDTQYPNARQTWAVRCNNSRSICFHNNEWQHGTQNFEDAVTLNPSSWLSPNNCGNPPPD